MNIRMPVQSFQARSHHTRLRPAGAVLAALIWVGLGAALPRASAAEMAPAGAYAPKPSYFVENRGQLNEEVRFCLQGGNQTVLFTDGAIYFVPCGAPKASAGADGAGAIKLALMDASKTEVVAGLPLPGKVNVFRGNDPAQWLAGIPTCGAVIYRDAYPGIDIRFYIHDDGLEYDVIVSAGGDPSQVRFLCTGIADLDVRPDGSLSMLRPDGTGLIQKKPRIYQADEAGGRSAVEGRFVAAGGFVYGFAVGAHDPDRALVIDPVIAYSTFYGGSSTDFARSVAVDAAGCAYVTGLTESADLALKNPIQKAYEGEEFVYLTDAFITKLDPSGKELVYSTYFGGSLYRQGSAADFARAIAVDGAGCACVTGYTNAADFPTKNALQPKLGGDSDAFVVKVSPTGDAVVFATYIGGNESDYGMGIAADQEGNILVAGYTTSDNFPCREAFQSERGGGIDACVFKIDPEGKALVYSTFLGGDEEDMCAAIAVDEDGNALVCGQTTSKNFPVHHAVQEKAAGAIDAFAAKFAPDGERLAATFLGGKADDFANGAAVDADGRLYLTGTTKSEDFPLKDPVQAVKRGYSDAFVLSLNKSGSKLLFSTYAGGDDVDVGKSVALDGSGRLCIYGDTRSRNFPLAKPVQQQNGGYNDLFIIRYTPSRDAIDFATFLGGAGTDNSGGMALDAAGNIYVVGWTRSDDFPTTEGSLQVKKANTFDAFITKISNDDPEEDE